VKKVQLSDTTQGTRSPIRQPKRNANSNVSFFSFILCVGLNFGTVRLVIKFLASFRMMGLKGQVVILRKLIANSLLLDLR